MSDSEEGAAKDIAQVDWKEGDLEGGAAKHVSWREGDLTEGAAKQVSWRDGDLEEVSSDETLCAGGGGDGGIEGDDEDSDFGWTPLDGEGEGEEECAPPTPRRVVPSPLMDALYTLTASFFVNTEMYCGGWSPGITTALIELVMSEIGEFEPPSGYGEGQVNLGELDNQGDPLLRELQKGMSIALTLIKLIMKMVSVLDQEIGTHGVIPHGTPEHKLCSAGRIELEKLSSSLSGFLKAFRKTFYAAIPNRIVLDALKLIPEVLETPRGEGSMADCDIYHSSVVKMGELATGSAEALFRVIFSICYVSLKEDGCEGHQKPLVDWIGTLAVLVDVVLQNFRDIKNVYMMEMAESTSEEKPKIPNYSPGNKMKRQCDLLIKWGQEFQEHCDLQRSAAVAFIELETNREENSEELLELTHQLAEMQIQSDDYMIQLQSLLKSQAKLRNDMEASLAPTKDIVSARDPAPEGDNNETDAAQDDPNLETAEGGNLEFSTKDGEQMDETSVEKPKDMLFVAYTGEGDGFENSEAEKPVESEAEVLYGGVMVQLKDALEPVKQKMMEREKEAVTKIIGIPREGSANSVANGSPEKKGKEAVDLPRSSRATSSRMLPTISETDTLVLKIDDADEPSRNDGAGDCFGGGFLAELRAKLPNQTMADEYQIDDFGDEADSAQEED